MPIDKLLSSSHAKTALTGALSGAAGGALTTALLNKKSAKNLLKAGGLVAVGGLAFKAWQTYKDNQADTNIPAPTPTALTTLANPVAQPSPQITQSANNEPLLILQSMIAAAHADGILTDLEQQQVWNKGVESGLPAEDLSAIAEALDNPATPMQLAASARTLETKIEVYTAAACVIDGDCEAGTAYLEALGSALELPPGLVNALKLSANQAG
jgi:uncharacterized membrane protein YebE (DUF533 family)